MSQDLHSHTRVYIKRASGTPTPGLSPATAQKAQAGRAGKRELMRAAPPGRWRLREKTGDCPRPWRRLRPRPLAYGRYRARRPTPGSRPRYRQAGGDPPSRGTRHRAMR